MGPRMLVAAALALVTVAAGLVAAVTPRDAEAAAGPVRTRIYYTGYSWYDNSPPGSAAIAYARSYGYPTVHDTAGGVGTWDNPVTLAVTLQDGKPLWRPGTRVYSYFLRKYAIVEDFAGAPGRRADFWINGRKVSREFAYRCMSYITGTRYLVVHPRPGRTVIRGSIAEWCRTKL